MVAVWSKEMVPAVAVNVADVAPAATVTEAGTERSVLSLLSETAAPPEGAALERVTVQELVPAGLRLVGVQESVLTWGKDCCMVTVPLLPAETVAIDPSVPTPTVFVS
jgi:hypothetical protein